MRKRLLLVISLIGLVIASCSGKNKNISMYPEDRLALALKLQDRGKCSKAVVEYERLLAEFPSQHVAERAKFGLAMCQIDLEEYDLARLTLEEFIDSYPKSSQVDNAMYLIAESYIREAPRPERDQSKTEKALSELMLLLREYPDTDVRQEAQEAVAACRSRLAQKEYLSGSLYLRLRYYESARLYFDSVLAEYSDTPWAGPALLGKGVSLAEENRLEEAREVFERVIADFPSTRASSEAAQRLKELGGGKESQVGTPSNE